MLFLVGLAIRAWSEGVHNLAGVDLLHCLSQAGIFRMGRFDGARCFKLTTEYVEDEPGPSRSYATGTSDYPLQSAPRQTGLIQNIDWFLKAGRNYKRDVGIYAVSPPIVLPEYEYVLALQKADRADWLQSLENFEQALIFRPRPWPSSFYDRYLETLTHVSPEQIERIGHEERVAPAISPEIKVGQKYQSDWDTAITVTDGWQLKGLTVLSWTKFDYSFPVPLTLFWSSPAESAKHETVTNENMIANGGFELGQRWEPTHMPIAGWYPENDADVLTRTVPHDGRSSTVLVLSPRGVKYSPLVDTNFIPIEPSTDSLLWGAWIDRSDGGNPMIFVLWFDPEKRFLQFEIPFQGNIVGDSGRHYAGVIQVPKDAAYVQVKLHNWQASGEALFDDLLLLPLKSPLP